MALPPASADDVKQFQVDVTDGEFVYHEGDTSVALYVVARGEVELLKEYAGGQRRMALLEAGDFFGEMSLLEGGPRDGSARAVGAARLVRVDPSTFDRIVREFPEIPIRMLYKLARRLREREEADARAAQIAMGHLQVPSEPAHVPPPAARQVPPAQAGGETSTSAGATVLRSTPTLQPVLEHRASNTRFFLPSTGELIVGRIDRATGQTPEIDLTAIDTTRSTGRRHARILCRDGTYLLREEAGTRNGTFINGRRIQSGEEARLADGDRLKFGLIEIELKYRPIGG